MCAHELFWLLGDRAGLRQRLSRRCRFCAVLHKKQERGRLRKKSWVTLIKGFPGTNPARFSHLRGTNTPLLGQQLATLALRDSTKQQLQGLAALVTKPLQIDFGQDPERGRLPCLHIALLQAPDVNLDLQREIAGSKTT